MSKFKDRTGENRKMHNGLTATVIAYRRSTDIDVMFSNGIIVHNVDYATAFKKGHIKCPLIIENVENYARVINVNTIPNTVFLIDARDLPLLDGKMWCMNNHGYITRKQNIKLHRIIANAPQNMTVDHINGNKADNRRSNLRICAQAENSRNVRTSKSNTSGYKGVWWHCQNKKWRASITLNGKPIHLGLYDDKIEAAKAYNKAAIRYHGEFAKLNKI